MLCAGGHPAALLFHAIDDVDVTQRCARDDMCEANETRGNQWSVAEKGSNDEQWGANTCFSTRDPDTRSGGRLVQESAKNGDLCGTSTRNSYGGAEGTRTPDPLHAMEVRYQLRHSPVGSAQHTRGPLAIVGECGRW